MLYMDFESQRKILIDDILLYEPIVKRKLLLFINKSIWKFTSCLLLSILLFNLYYFVFGWKGIISNIFTGTLIFLSLVFLIKLLQVKSLITNNYHTWATTKLKLVMVSELDRYSDDNYLYNKLVVGKKEKTIRIQRKSLRLLKSKEKGRYFICEEMDFNMMYTFSSKELFIGQLSEAAVRKTLC